MKEGLSRNTSSSAARVSSFRARKQHSFQPGNLAGWDSGRQCARRDCFRSDLARGAHSFRGPEEERISRKIVAGQPSRADLGETLAKLPPTGDQVVCLGRDQAAWSGSALMSSGGSDVRVISTPADRLGHGARWVTDTPSTGSERRSRFSTACNASRRRQTGRDALGRGWRGV
jgi:hypothetical protein